MRLLTLRVGFIPLRIPSRQPGANESALNWQRGCPDLPKAGSGTGDGMVLHGFFLPTTLTLKGGCRSLDHS